MKTAFAGALVLVLAVLGLAGIAAADLAPAPYGPQTPPAWPGFSVQSLQGFAVNEDSLGTEPAVLVRVTYSGRVSTHLLIGETFYKLHEMDRQWVENGEVIRYSIKGSSESILLYSGDGFGSSAFGQFGKRMLVFQPPYYAYRNLPGGGVVVPENAAGDSPPTPIIPVRDAEETPAD